MKRISALLSVLIFLVAADAAGDLLRVPADYSTIQAAINAAVEGDTVLVAPGTYFENLNFRGKNIVVASHFILGQDHTFIESTVIDGSDPQHPDSASCVLIVSGEDSSAVLEGFTLTGGTGTLWVDEHGAGTFREGGGVLVTLSSPTIRNNLIIQNRTINRDGAVSAGGGAIRCGDAAARIVNNVIMDNEGMYGAGIVLNYCSGALVRNNVFTGNRVYQAVSGAQTFGGGGIWVFETLPGNNTPNVIENNTIVGNSSFGDPVINAAGRGGAILVWSASVTARNNIVRGNSQARGEPIGSLSSTLNVTYSAVEGGQPGTGNIDAHPLFADSSYYLSDSSPCIDAGDPDAIFNDPEDPPFSGTAEWPSRGTVRNDMGAYGGPERGLFPTFSRPDLSLSSLTFDFGNILPGMTGEISIPVLNGGAGLLFIDSVHVMTGTDISVRTTLPLMVSPAATDTVDLEWSPSGNGLLVDTLLLYHNDTSAENPQRIQLLGNADPTPLLFVDTDEFNFGDIDVNTPHRDSTFVVNNLGTGADSVYVSIDYKGVQPDSALSVSPAAFSLAAGDSQVVTFTIFPPVIVRTILDIYAPDVVIDSRFGIGETQFAKRMRFRIVGTLTGVESSEELPRFYELNQNYPNPFNPGTTIEYQLPRESRVTLKIYDLLGEEVTTLVDGEQKAGYYEVKWTPDRFASGVYYYRLSAVPSRSLPRVPSRGSGQGISGPSLHSGQWFVEIKKLMLLR